MERPGFYVSHEAHYRVVKGREIMIGDYPEGAGTPGEFAIRWHSDDPADCPRLEAWSDSWGVLAKMVGEHDLIRRLAELAKNAEPESVAALLMDLGFEDLTARADPAARERVWLRRSALAKLTPAERSALGVVDD